MRFSSIMAEGRLNGLGERFMKVTGFMENAMARALIGIPAEHYIVVVGVTTSVMASAIINIRTALFMREIG